MRCYRSRILLEISYLLANYLDPRNPDNLYKTLLSARYRASVSTVIRLSLLILARREAFV